MAVKKKLQYQVREREKERRTKSRNTVLCLLNFSFPKRGVGGLQWGGVVLYVRYKGTSCWAVYSFGVCFGLQ